jgi:hypothetical protein
MHNSLKIIKTLLYSYSALHVSGTLVPIIRSNTTHVHCMLDTLGYKHTSEYVIFIAFPLQQWLCESASMWRHSYIACLLAVILTAHTLTNRLYNVNSIYLHVF